MKLREIIMSEKDLARFWPKIDVAGADECWNWNAGFGHGGYGLFQLNKRAIGAHRIAWTIAFGEIPQDKPFICHRCDNPKCCNPSHLFAGTPNDNVQDCKSKGRFPTGDKSPSRTRPERLARGDRNGSRKHPERLAFGDRNWTRMFPERLLRGSDHHAVKTPEVMARGEKHGMSKLTTQMVLDIRARAAAGEPSKSIGLLHGITPGTVRKVVRKKLWSHV